MKTFMLQRQDSTKTTMERAKTFANYLTPKASEVSDPQKTLKPPARCCIVNSDSSQVEKDTRIPSESNQRAMWCGVCWFSSPVPQELRGDGSAQGCRPGSASPAGKSLTCTLGKIAAACNDFWETIIPTVQ